MASSIIQIFRDIYQLHRQAVQRSGLSITKGVQLDTVLLFLRTLPAESSLITYTTAWNTVVLCVSDDEQTTTDQGMRDLLIKLVDTTVKPWSSRISVRSAVADARVLLGQLPCPARTGVVLCVLSTIGVSLSSAVTEGLFQPAPFIPLPTPTECLAALLDELQEAFTSISDSEQLLLVSDIIQRGEEKRLLNDMDICTVKPFLKTIRADLASAGLESLRDHASSLLDKVQNHGPDGPPLTRLMDNIYGRVWESFLNAELVDNMPPKVLESVQIMEEELAEIIRQIPYNMGHVVGENFLTKMKDRLPLHWVESDVRLKTFINLKHPGQFDLLELVMKRSSNGQEVASAFFIAGRLIISLQDLDPNYFPWTASTTGWYKRDIVPMKGKTKFAEESNNHYSGSGIMLPHQPPMDDSPAHFRTVVNRVWDMDIDEEGDTPSPNILALHRGLGYGSGISGHMFMFVRFFLDIKDRRKDFLLPHAILGLLIFMTVAGGHTWHEGLQTVNFLEYKIGLGVLPQKIEPSTYIADYAQFISIFDIDTQNYLERAIRHANKMTILYRRKYTSSPFSCSY